jgi:hypothetical protein
LGRKNPLRVKTQGGAAIFSKQQWPVKVNHLRTLPDQYRRRNAK